MLGKRFISNKINMYHWVPGSMAMGCEMSCLKKYPVASCLVPQMLLFLCMSQYTQLDLCPNIATKLAIQYHYCQGLCWNKYHNVTKNAATQCPLILLLCNHLGFLYSFSFGAFCHMATYEYGVCLHLMARIIFVTAVT